jgi:hypothetical protein
MLLNYEGYYSTVSNHPQVVQGSYYEILKDPLYVQDISQSLIPLSNKNIYTNKKYIPRPDLLTADENYYNKPSRKKLKGDGNNLNYYMSNNYFQKDKYSSIQYDDVDKPINHAIRDIRKGNKEIVTVKHREPKPSHRPILHRPKPKIVNARAQRPGANLKQSLLKKKKPKTKRDQLKKLIESIR